MGKECRIYEKMNAHRVSVRRLEGRRTLKRPRCRWKDDIEMDLRSTLMD
jgi:hypothetical protein